MKRGTGQAAGVLSALVLSAAAWVSAQQAKPVPALQPAKPAAPATLPTTRPALPATRPAESIFLRPATLPAQTIEKIEKLIARLGDENWQTRGKAQDELIQMGQDAKARLEQLKLQTRDEEVRTRAEAALRQIEENRLTGISYVTIHLKNAGPRDVFGELARQSNATIKPTPANLWESRQFKTVDIDIEREPFWRAVRTICEKTGLSLQQNGVERDMSIVEGNVGNRIFGEAPSVISGPFMVVAQSITRSNYLDLNQPKNINRSCNMQFYVFPEPKLRVLQGSYQARLTEAVDDKGNDLIFKQNIFDGLQPRYNWAWMLQASLSPKAGGGDRIVRLRGSARFLIQTRSESTEIPDILSAKNMARTVAGRRFVLKEVRKQNAESFVVSITLYRAGWSQAEWSSNTQETFRLVDAKGISLFRTSNNMGGGPDSMEITLHFQKQNWNGGPNAGDPTKLIWEVPIETREITVPFEFKDIPLP